ncbi:hypothetical protein FM112_09830 [Gulosibacter sp. 10]|nr:hypothetical protein FM112_09830 [Gulosibacter sp. 10]
MSGSPDSGRIAALHPYMGGRGYSPRICWCVSACRSAGRRAGAPSSCCADRYSSNLR